MKYKLLNAKDLKLTKENDFVEVYKTLKNVYTKPEIDRMLREFEPLKRLIPYIDFIEELYVAAHPELSYMGFEAIETGTFQFSGTGMYYSVDDCQTWNSLAADTNTPTVNAGEKIYFKSEITPDSTNGIGTFTSTGQFNAFGNTMSLIYGDAGYGKVALPDYSFMKLFLNNTNIVNAEDLLLPALTTANSYYSSMFMGCTALETAPELPATGAAKSSCCESMFNGCTSLTTAPEINTNEAHPKCYTAMFMGCTALETAPSRIVVNNVTPDNQIGGTQCCLSMFNGCTSLTTPPELPATYLSTRCYEGMFKNCTGLTTAPELPATTIADQAYASMFYGCTSLTTAPELPGTTFITTSPYTMMFYDCTSLTTAPSILPAMSLCNACYRQMFMGCTALETAPVLPALIVSRTYSQYAYSSMFQGCTSLNYVKAMFTDYSALDGTWLLQVAANGTFVKNSEATWENTAQINIPSGWTIQTASN